MIRPVRTPLTPDQTQVADSLKALWLSRKDALELTQAKAAAAIGITQGSLTQYLNKHIAVNADFLLKFCELLRVDPADVHPQYAHIILTEPHRVLVTHEWGKERELRKPTALPGVLLDDRQAFAVRMTKASPIPDAVVICSRDTDRPVLGWLSTGPRWTITWRAQKPKPPAGRPWWNVVGLVTGG